MKAKTTKSSSKSAKKVKVKKSRIVYLVTYDILDDGDPVKEFSTLQEAKLWVQGTLTNEDHEDDEGREVDMTSFKIYKATLIGKPKITVTFD
jgi:hypothetical protein